MLVGDPYASDEAGAIYAFGGGADGVGAIPMWERLGPVGKGYGTSVAFLGDVNGDESPDIAAGSGGSRGSVAVVYYGTVGGLPGSTQPDWVFDVDPALDAKTPGSHAVVGRGGDVDGNGLNDLLVAAPAMDVGKWAGQGTAWVFLGQLGALDSLPAWQVEEGTGGEGAALGTDLTGISDLDGDGDGELMITSPGEDVFSNGVLFQGAGEVRLYEGSEIGPATSWSFSESSLDVTPTAAPYSVREVGDVNGDAAPEVAIGAYPKDSHSRGF